MTVKDFVIEIIKLMSDPVDVCVNDTVVYDSANGLIFSEVLYRMLFLTDIEFTGRTVYITGNLPTIRISEAVAEGKQYLDGRLIVTQWAMYLREGFVITEIASRSDIKEMFNL